MAYIGPFAFNGIRFALGALVLAPLAWRRRPLFPHGHDVSASRAHGHDASASRAHGRDESAPRARPLVLRDGLIAGLILFAGASLQQIGMVYTTAGKAGFITSLYVVLVPLLGVLFFRYRVGFYNALAALLAAAGLYLLSMHGRLALERGDAFILAGAFAWALHVLVIARFAARSDPLRLASLQFAICGILSLLVMAFRETPTPAGLRGALLPLLYGGLLSVTVAYTLQVVAQRHAHPAPAAIILSLEAVFAAIGGALVLREALSSRELAGCVLMLAGVILSQARGRAALPQAQPSGERADTAVSPARGGARGR